MSDDTYLRLYNEIERTIPSIGNGIILPGDTLGYWGFDSLDLAELLINLEEEFDIEVYSSELEMMDDTKTIAEIASFIELKRQEGL